VPKTCVVKYCGSRSRFRSAPIIRVTVKFKCLNVSRPVQSAFNGRSVIIIMRLLYYASIIQQNYVIYRPHCCSRYTYFFFYYYDAFVKPLQAFSTFASGNLQHYSKDLRCTCLWTEVCVRREISTLFEFNVLSKRFYSSLLSALEGK